MDAPLQALIFDSVYNSFRGIIVYYRILNGVLKKNDKIRFISTGSDYNADEVGVLKLNMTPKDEVRAGDVGY
ncbi:EF-Tu/IF-2/RF-3 family GTPase, partial [Acinetobacter baumannii]